MHGEGFSSGSLPHDGGRFAGRRRVQDEAVAIGVRTKRQRRRVESILLRLLKIEQMCHYLGPML